MTPPTCPKCESTAATKSGMVGGRQRFKCKSCGYHYTVAKVGKEIDSYYVIKALQLYLEGVSYREIERLLGVSHVSVMNWVKKYAVRAPRQTSPRPSYQLLSQRELVAFFQDPANVRGAGVVVTAVGEQFLLLRWEQAQGD